MKLRIFTIVFTVLMCGGVLFGRPLDVDAVVELRESPVDYQLYPRDETNRGWVVFSGRVNVDLVREIRVRSWRDGQRWYGVRQLVDSSEFSLRIPIEAGLFSYRVEVWVLLKDGREEIISGAGELVAGDVFLIQGQSNAVAGDYHGEHLANESQSPWIRSYGTASTNPDDVRNDRKWHLADGELINKSGTVGAWGLRMARLTVDTYGIPIALLNGAVGGTPISYHQRDDNDPMNLNTNYGRLLWRSREAGVADYAKAIFWYQGESDTQIPLADYFTQFRDLYQDWNTDYPGIEHVYECQIRDGCGDASISMRDMMRRFGDIFPKVEGMSTTAIHRHDGCHFFYEGYRELGDRLARLIARDFHGLGDVNNITAPNPLSASWTNSAHDEILIRMRVPTDGLIVDSGAYLNFRLLGGSPSEKVVSVEAAGPGKLLVGLSGRSRAKGIGYDGHSGDGPWVRNSRGVGLFVFRVLIE